MQLLCLISLVWGCLSLACAVTVKGRFDVDAINITGVTWSKSFFKLYQVGNYTGLPYRAQAQLKNDEGDFEFKGLPVNPGINETTHFVLYSSSIDFNLKPNRVLVELVSQDENGENVQINAYRNIFGKEYFPSSDIAHPEKLDKIEMDGYIPITLIQMAPIRAYYENRNTGMFQSGPLASIMDSKWKQAGLITAATLMIFPYILEKLDPETAKAVSEEKLRKQREKYQIKED
ncbi:related to protein SOP4 [Zygosaccharomyces bailii]|nr:related to protein SOP4 [Zygosaccharomyces bailii]